MIPKKDITWLAARDGLRPTVVEKDYALGWLLCGIAQNELLSRWVFKGGTCLKKCFFETYRFSEDLDFTVPQDVELDAHGVERALSELCEWVAYESGLQFPAERMSVELYENKRGTESIQAKVGYVGPLRMSGQRMQRVKLDITQNEVLVDVPLRRLVFHRYADAREPAPMLACYSANEILAEKTRALYERQGRARDVYDVINIHRNFHEEIDGKRARQILHEKFVHKDLPSPTINEILAQVDHDDLALAWQQQLAHQLPVLPPLQSFIEDLAPALTWWMAPDQARPTPDPAPLEQDDEVVSDRHFARRILEAPSLSTARPPQHGRRRVRTSTAEQADAALDRVRLGARNRLRVEVAYKGISRVVEPYSLRYARGTGNTHLYVYELERARHPSNRVKRFDIRRLESARVLERPFHPRWAIEL